MRTYQCTHTIRVCGLAAMALTILLSYGPGSRAEAVGAAKVVLFTPQEARELRLSDREWRHVPEARALAAGPQIIIRRPRLVPEEISTIEAESPTELDVIFEPRAAPVLMDSLHVEARKGFFSKSLTELLRPYIHGDEIAINNVQIPNGRFMLEISIADTNGNITDSTYRLEVGPK